MRVNEVKQTKTIEEVVRTEYIAEDGEVFSNKEECKKYEESALFAVSKQLKRLDNKKNRASEYDIYDECSEEYLVEIFNAETERDIENIRRYVYLKALSKSSYARKEDVDLPNITAGHEVIIHWNYDEDGCWTIGNGSIDAFCDYIRSNLVGLITPKEEKAE
nr:MAG TPA: hypothetical protein [Caudoviricetes sp.]